MVPYGTNIFKGSGRAAFGVIILNLVLGDRKVTI